MRFITGADLERENIACQKLTSAIEADRIAEVRDYLADGGVVYDYHLFDAICAERYEMFMLLYNHGLGPFLAAPFENPPLFLAGEPDLETIRYCIWKLGRGSPSSDADRTLGFLKGRECEKMLGGEK
jgi:hypothetical protein